MQSTPLEVQENLALADRLIDQVAGEDVQLVVLPEMFNVGFYFGKDLMTVAEPLDGKTVTWLKSQADRHDVYITTSLYERHEGHFYNTMVMVGSDESLQYYRKRNPTLDEVTVWRRSEAPGPGIFDTPFGRVGGVICFDSFARETFEGFSRSAVELVVIVACWGAPQVPVWRPDLMPARPVLQRWSQVASEVVPRRYATQLKVPTVFVNQGGNTHTPGAVPGPWPALSNYRFDFRGKSSVRDASGTMLTQARETETEFCAVASTDVQPSDARPDPARTGTPPHYLDADYYFVQPPYLAKVLQSWWFRGLQGEYETRRKRYAA